MDEYSKKLEELKSLMGYTDDDSIARKEELFVWFENNSGGTGRQLQLDNFIKEGIAEQKHGIETLQAEADPTYELIPMAYIARKYFGKSRQWLYQRINGSGEHCHAYSLDDKQKATFNLAIQEIASQLSSVRLV